MATRAAFEAARVAPPEAVRGDHGVSQGSSCSQGEYAEGGHRLREALEPQPFNELSQHEWLDVGVDLLADQDLAPGRLRAEACRQVRHGADGGIIKPSFEADLAQSGLAVGYPNPEVQVMTTRAPALRQLAD